MASGSAAGAGGSAVTWQVVSDVDHTLLEEPGETPSAGQALRQLGQRGIPTLLASKRLDSESYCHIDGIVAVDWSKGGPHPRTYK